MSTVCEVPCLGHSVATTQRKTRDKRTHRLQVWSAQGPCFWVSPTHIICFYFTFCWLFPFLGAPPRTMFLDCPSSQHLHCALRSSPDFCSSLQQEWGASCFTPKTLQLTILRESLAPEEEVFFLSVGNKWASTPFTEMEHQKFLALPGAQQHCLLGVPYWFSL